MILDTTTRKLQANLAGAPATTNPQVVVDWVEITATTMIAGTSPSNLAGAGLVDILAAPTVAATQRKVNAVHVYNLDTAPVICTVTFNDGGTPYVLIKVTLAIGDTLVWTDPQGWYIIDSSGGIKSAPRSGLFIKTTTITAGVTFTTGPTTNTARFRLQGGGGGGGGVGANAAGNGTCGGGGSPGGYAEKTFGVNPNTAYTIALGAGGTGGAAGGGNGGVGGITTVQVGATTVTANGGLGGTFLATGAVHNYALGGAAPAVSTNGDVNGSGDNGRVGVIIVAGVVGIGGAGGSCLFGAGGKEVKVSNAGQNPIGFGAGGGGALSLSGALGAGGATGAGGIIVVDEYT